MSSFDDTNEMKAFTKKAMSIPLLAEEREKVLAKKWIEKKDESALHELTQSRRVGGRRLWLQRGDRRRAGDLHQLCEGELEHGDGI